jgi:type VI secretion system secreted protein VgrG
VKRRVPNLITLIGLMVLVMSSTMLRAAPGGIDLLTADGFAVLAGSTITNTGLSTVTGDVGLHPGTSVTGFDDGADSVTQAGAMHVADGVAAQAKIDLGAAYDDAASRGATRVGTELASPTPLKAGVYDSAAGTFGITGTLTLDAENIPDAVFIFKMASTLTTASASIVELINGADACNVFWQVGSSATLGTFSSFKGNILAMASITVTTGVNIVGSTLARSGAVTMDTNTITDSSCAAAATPSPTATPTPTAEPTATPTPTAEPTATPTPTAAPTGSPTATPIVPVPVQTSTPSAIPSAAPSSPPIVPVAVPTPTAPAIAILTTPATPHAAAVPSASPTATSSGSVPTPSGPSDTDVALGGGPALPRTGTPVGMLVLVALGLVGAGEFLRRSARYAEGK